MPPKLAGSARKKVNCSKKAMSMLKQKLLSSSEKNDDVLPAVLKEHLDKSGKSIYQLSNDSGVDSAYIWRVLNSERREVSREILILMSVALVLDERSVDALVEVANALLDAAGYRPLRPER